eukprot:NODE_13994_length_1134_cov_9.966236.p1 GENE.NODE_13994_length_1134_cov_9.966236~~NODE_13994_length_1134_cov_9.966236.p1  ORF type:complete len:290 (+),score=65.32 NODE_13994_length_1134_cov_9.966236:129-998(+)
MELAANLPQLGDYFTTATVDELRMMLLFGNVALFAVILYLRGTRKTRQSAAAAEPACARRRALLVIAHPDDEAMFFGPTLLSLAADGYEVFLLCLSTGNAYGLGEVRREEILRSAAVFGIGASSVRVLDEANLQDGMTREWPLEEVAAAVRHAVDDWRIESVVSFDAGGVSGHPNHAACCNGVVHWYTSTDPAADLRVWALASVPLRRKYVGLLDVPLSLLGPGVAIIAPSPWRCVRAMLHHRSQLVWYRWLSIALSRYTFVNTLLAVRHPAERAPDDAGSEARHHHED